MNTQNFNQSGGFPIKTQTLDEMQKAYSLFNSLGKLAGDFGIISGCVVSGTAVSDGVVFINDEVLPFQGGQIGTNVIIVETITQKEFKDGSTKDVVYTRHATFGVATTSYPWSNFLPSFPTTQIPAALDLKEDKTVVTALLARIVALEARPPSNIPLWGIILFDRPAADIPAGWAEYIPLKGRMAVGHDDSYTQDTDQIDYQFNTLGYAGGAKEHQLTKAELPNYNLLRNVGLLVYSGIGSLFAWSSEPGAGATQVINSGGSDKPHNNMSPYRIVKYIQRVV